MHVDATPMRSKGLLTVSAIALLASAGVLFTIPQAVRGISSAKFLPHVYCYLYDRRLIGLHVGSDTAIWLSYVSISVSLAYLVYRTRREIPFSWMFLAFGTFIIACGFTHFMEVVVLWKPLYWLSGDVKLLTAVASLITAVALPPLVPKIHDMVLAVKASGEHKASLEIANRELFRSNESLEAEVERRTRAERDLQVLSGRLLKLQDDERRRLARELHDSTGQILTAIQLNISIAESMDGVDPTLRRRLEETVQLTNQAIREVRTMSYLLHPPMLDEAGLLLAVQWYVEGFTQRSDVQVNVELPSRSNRLPPEVELAMFRIVQESLTNIHRHSGSKQADIRLEASENELKLTIRDYGKGIPPHLADRVDGNEIHRAGVGLRGMAERIRQLGGTLFVGKADPGTIVEARLPFSGSRSTTTGNDVVSQAAT